MSKIKYIYKNILCCVTQSSVISSILFLSKYGIKYCKTHHLPNDKNLLHFDRSITKRNRYWPGTSRIKYMFCVPQGSVIVAILFLSKYGINYCKTHHFPNDKNPHFNRSRKKLKKASQSGREVSNY